MTHAHDPALKASLAPVQHHCVERRSFPHFTERASRIMSGFHNPDFWYLIMACWANESDSIWQAIVALSLLQESMESSSGFSSNVGKLWNDKRSMIWYSRAVSKTKELSLANDGIRPELLVGCVLFVMIDFQQCNIESALRLLDISLRMFLELHDRHALSDDLSITKFLTQSWSLPSNDAPTLQALLSHKASLASIPYPVT